MSAEIILFAAKTKPVAKIVARDGLGYYCLRCDAEEFRAFADGEVYCVNCGAYMKNLQMKERD